MRLGFVNFNTEEKKRVSKLMRLLSESAAIEELGIGRVRDHFSNTLFPGTSTLQHHAKYFAILPSLYYHAAHCGRKFTGVREVERFVIECEIQITRRLAEHDDGSSKLGITGINTYKEALSDYTKFVKYNPTYIYGIGMVTFGMVPDSGIYQLIMEMSKTDAEEPRDRRRSHTDDPTGDALELTGERQLIITSGERYDFEHGATMPLALTVTEAKFIKDKILESPYCKGTLLAFLLSKDSLTLTGDVGYFNLREQLDGLDEAVRDVYDKSVLFSKLVNLLDWSFNHAYYCSFGNGEDAMACEQAYEVQYHLHRRAIEDRAAYRALFDYTRERDPMLTDFCEQCHDVILEAGANALDTLDLLVAARERSVKRERSKIGNRAYRDVKRGNPDYNEFRWSTVRTMVDEIRNPG